MAKTDSLLALPSGKYGWRGRPDDLKKEDCWRYSHRYVGRAIHLTRELKRLTQQSVASQLSKILDCQEIGQSYISKVESGDTAVSLERLMAICKVLSIEPHHMIKIATELCELDVGSDETILEKIYSKTSGEAALETSTS